MFNEHSNHSTRSFINNQHGAWYTDDENNLKKKLFILIIHSPKVTPIEVVRYWGHSITKYQLVVC